MDVDAKTAAIGILLIGVVAMAGWVGFLYVNPVTKTKTKEEEKTVYVIQTKTITEEAIRDGIPLNFSGLDFNSYITIYNETGDENRVYLSDILQGINLYWEQEDQPDYKRINEYKPEYMELNSVVDEVTGGVYTGVDLMDLLCFANCYYADNISCKGTSGGTNGYFNTTMQDVVYKSSRTGGRHPTIIAIAANDTFLDNFALVQGDSDQTVYDLQEIRALTEWEIEIYVNDVLQHFRINRTTIVDPNYPDGWTYGYFKEPSSANGQYNYNRTYWGTNMSSLLDQCEDIDILSTNFNITEITLVDGVYGIEKLEWGPQNLNLTYSCGLTFNNTDVRDGLDYPLKYGVVNATETELPKITDPALIMVMAYKERRLSEYGVTRISGVFLPTSEDPWDKGYRMKYGGGPFQLIIPGQTGNNYPKWVTRIYITTF
ncbi:MAG: hypothetical protein ACFFDK_03760 [Promethearchaeota archaeon]